MKRLWNRFVLWLVVLRDYFDPYSHIRNKKVATVPEQPIPEVRTVSQLRNRPSRFSEEEHIKANAELLAACEQEYKDLYAATNYGTIVDSNTPVVKKRKPRKKKKRARKSIKSRNHS
jgi:hypothetical protein